MTRRATTRELLERSHPAVDSPTYRALAGLDPDPRHVPEDDRAVDGYANDLSPTASCLVVAICAVAIILVLIAQLLAASRPGPNPTAPTPAPDVAGLALASTLPATSASGSGQSGAPLAAIGLASTAPGGAPSPAVANVATSGGPSGLTASTPASISGPATWYDAPTIHDAAAGPRLRKALGRDWRGSIVEVCAGRCVTVILSDWCACGLGRVIDLDDRAFARLAPLSQGIVRVSIELRGAIGEPATATAPPTDVER